MSERPGRLVADVAEALAAQTGGPRVRWFYLGAAGPGRGIMLPPYGVDFEERICGGPVDHGSLSRHFAYIVYEHSIAEYPKTCSLWRRGAWGIRLRTSNDGGTLLIETDVRNDPGQAATDGSRAEPWTELPIHAPCLVYKVDDHGATVSMTEGDVARLQAMFKAATEFQDQRIATEESLDDA